MGELNVKSKNSEEELRRFTKNLLNDVNALEKMLENDLFEKNVRRIGAEQEFFMVDKSFRPAPIGMEILEKIKDEHFTSEIARFNLEFNLDPLDFGAKCLSQLEADMKKYIKMARAAMASTGHDLALVGILPTIRKSDLSLNNMTPFDRYFALNDTIKNMRGEDYSFRIKGIDELFVTHDSVMLEACNTSFQLHFQVSPENFAPLYNFAQVVTAPVLAASVNSPMLFGNRLWKETRIALFQQAVDTRGSKDFHRQRLARVSFGNKWVNESVLELFREDISRYRVLFSSENEEDSLKELEEGKIPKLKALSLHNGTVYRWNRPCYGIFKGKAHLRIENRVIPSGPTPLDATANAAFFFGLMSGISREYEDIRNHMEFETASHNFTSAARNGLEAQFRWFNNHTHTAKDIILSELLPLASHGLESSKINSSDRDRYLSVIEERVKSGNTGAWWMLNSYSKLRKTTSNDSILSSLTSALIKREKSGKPVHEWESADKDDVIELNQGYSTVDQFMSTDLYTVHESDLVDLAANLIDWQYIRHIPVENNEGKLVGLVSYRQIVRQFAKIATNRDTKLASIADIMTKDLIVIPPSTSTLDAIQVMKKNRITCLPVVENNCLLGLVRETDFIQMASDLLLDKLAEK